MGDILDQYDGSVACIDDLVVTTLWMDDTNFFEMLDNRDTINEMIELSNLVKIELTTEDFYTQKIKEN